MRIPTRLLRKMRQVSEDLMPDLVTIRTPGDPAPDGRGGTTLTFTDSDPVKCRWAPKSGKLDDVVANRAGNREVFEFSMPITVTLTETFRLLQGEVEYEIVSVVSAKSYDVVRRVLAVRL